MPLVASASQAVMWAKRERKKLAAKDWLSGVELAVVEGFERARNRSEFLEGFDEVRREAGTA
jgi:hypothetical protein